MPSSGSFEFLEFAVSLAAVTSLLSIMIFGFELEQKKCMDRLPWNLLELVFPIFMVLLIGVASIVGLITGATVDDSMSGYKNHCFASSILGLLDCIPWAIQAFFQFSINRSL